MLELELPRSSTVSATTRALGDHERGVASQVHNNRLLNDLLNNNNGDNRGGAATANALRVADPLNPAVRSGHPADDLPMPSPSEMKRVHIDDPTLYIYVKRYGGTGLLKLKAHDALTHVTGLHFLHLSAARLKHELKQREITLGTGMRGRERMMELSSRLEKAVISERNRKLRQEGKDKLSTLRKDLSLVGAQVAKLSNTLFDAALLRSDFDHMLTMVARGAASANFESNDAFTPLIRAAFCRNVDATERLLDLGADPDLENRVGESPLVWASAMPLGAAVIVALCGVSAESKAPPSRSATPATGDQAKNDNDDDDTDDMMNLEVAKKKHAASGKTAASRFDQAKERITLNPDRPHATLDRETALGVTGLMAACEAGHLDNVVALVELGANINYKTNRRGLCALHVASRYGQNQIALYLLDHGAVVNAKDHAGRDARDWARAGGFHKLAETLELQAWRWKRAEVRKNAGSKLWRKLRTKTKALKVQAGWDCYIDPASQQEFYINGVTGVAVWEMPESVLKLRRSSWKSRTDPLTGDTYYYNDAGESTYEMPAILDEACKLEIEARPNMAETRLVKAGGLFGKSKRTINLIGGAAGENADEIDDEVLDALVSRSRHHGLKPVPSPTRNLDGYHGVVRILASAKHLERDRLTVTKVEWDARTGGVRGRMSALHRSQEAESEYWVELHKGLLGLRFRAPYARELDVAPTGVFVSKVVVGGQADRQSNGRTRVGHWVQQINNLVVRDTESTVVARMIDRSERPFRIKFRVPACVCDYCGSASPHTVCTTCDAILVSVNCVLCVVHVVYVRRIRLCCLRFFLTSSWVILPTFSAFPTAVHVVHRGFQTLDPAPGP